ncbi:MAG: SIS domain-containing protein [Leptospirillia bacterium]
MKQQIETALDDHLSVMTALKGASDALESVAVALITSYRQGGKLLVFGNGGSAADAQHIAAELVGRFEAERAGLAAIALTTDTSALTAIANDFGYERIFARQVEALARPGDVAIGISTSGNSGNVVQGIERAREAGCVTVALTGKDGGKLGGIADHHINVPHHSTARVQEGHITLGHILCQLVETGLAEDS